MIAITGMSTARLAIATSPADGVNPPSVCACTNSILSAPARCAFLQSSTEPQQTSICICSTWPPPCSIFLYYNRPARPYQAVGGFTSMNFYAILFKSLLYYERQCEFSHCLSSAHCLAPLGQPAMTAKKIPHFAGGTFYFCLCRNSRRNGGQREYSHCLSSAHCLAPLGHRQ